jgi:hypothetical protein
MLAGCGGGGDDTTSTAADATIPTVTSPNLNQGGGATTTAPNGSGARRANPAHPQNLPPGAQPVEEALAPFRDCLSRHGVDPANFAPGHFRQGQQDPAEMNKRIQASIACIPELPPRARRIAERIKRRYEQRQPNGGSQN